MGLNQLPNGTTPGTPGIPGCDPPTTDPTPAQIHQIGLDEVARIHGEMRKGDAAGRLQGSLQDFFEHMRTDKQFEFKSEDALLASITAGWRRR